MNPDCPENAKDCPRMGLRASAPLMHHELRRFNLTDRERTIAGVILSLTWEEGIAAVRVPKLDLFEHMTGLAANHVGETLHDLEKLMRVIVVTEVEEGKTYALNPKTENWQVKPRVSRGTMLETLNLLREINGVARQTEGQLNFKLQVVANFLAKVAPEMGVLPKQEAV